MADVEYVDQNAFTPELVRDADALLIRTRTRCDRNLLENSTVKLVATATIGMDQIDMPWCRKAGITVRNSPGCNAPAVAQYVWSSLLRLGFTPGKHRLGLVGSGNVGGIVAYWGRLMGVEVLVSDPPRQRFGIEDNYYPLEKIMKECDAVTLHTPLTRDGEYATFHLIGEKELEAMRPGAILVNAARGPVVDFRALEKILESGRIRAVIDTWEGEPVVNPRVLEHSDIATFHIAGYSRQGKERATRMVLEAVENRFGVSVDKSGLEGAYVPPFSIDAETIVGSYDPFADDAALRGNPGEFETLRHDYRYREETGSL